MSPVEYYKLCPECNEHFDARRLSQKYCTDEWSSYKKFIPKEKHIISKKKTTHIERRNRDFRTHIKRLCRETACFSKADDIASLPPCL